MSRRFEQLLLGIFSFFRALQCTIRASNIFVLVGNLSCSDNSLSQMGINYAKPDRAIAPPGLYSSQLKISHAGPDRAIAPSGLYFGKLSIIQIWR